MARCMQGTRATCTGQEHTPGSRDGCVQLRLPSPEVVHGAVHARHQSCQLLYTALLKLWSCPPLVLQSSHGATQRCQSKVNTILPPLLLLLQPLRLLLLLLFRQPPSLPSLLLSVLLLQGHEQHRHLCQGCCHLPQQHRPLPLLPPLLLLQLVLRMLLLLLLLALRMPVLPQLLVRLLLVLLARPRGQLCEQQPLLLVAL